MAVTIMLAALAAFPLWRQSVSAPVVNLSFTPPQAFPAPTPVAAPAAPIECADSDCLLSACRNDCAPARGVVPWSGDPSSPNASVEILSLIGDRSEVAVLPIQRPEDVMPAPVLPASHRARRLQAPLYGKPHRDENATA
ncbi:MAG: hypothetical protein QXH27_04335 [Candidatus Micrarchaeia archaeon]